MNAAGESASALTDCSGGRAAGATRSDGALAARLSGMRLEVGPAHSGEWAGSWSSRFPVARLFYVLATGPDVGLLSDSQTQTPLLPGCWALLPPGRRIRHVQPAGIDVVSVHFRLVTGDGLEALGECGLCGGVAPDWRDAFLELERCQAKAETPPLGLAFRVEGCIWEAIAALCERDGDLIAARLSGAERFAPLVEAVARSPERDFSVRDMARIMRMGESAFAKNFVGAMGESPRRWFNGRRAHAAALALLEGMSVSAVAEKFGFCDEYYFSRFFKRHFGQSPSNWRRRHL